MKSKILFLFLPFVLIVFIQCKTNQSGFKNQKSDFEKGVPILIDPENRSSCFGAYNTSPESPDGTKIAYIKIFSEQKERFDKMTGELWICNTDLTNHKKVITLDNFVTHNGVETQWIDNNRIAFSIQGQLKIVNLNGEDLIKPLDVFSIGHEPHENKILYSAISAKTNLYTIYEYDIATNQKREIADASAFKDAINLFSIKDTTAISKRKIHHLTYSPDGKKIGFRADFAGKGEIDNLLITMNINGGDIQFFGPKPMHFNWFDNNSIMGHDNQIADDNPNDFSARKWTRNGKYLETLAGPGNHLAASPDRKLIASESWYRVFPVILSVYKKGETTAFWQDTISTDGNSVWKFGNHVNPAFSRDGKRVYYRKSSAVGQSQAYMVVLPNH